MREEPFDTVELWHGSQKYTAKLYYDTDSGMPWDDCDCHGPVRRSNYPHGSSGDKRPGERPLNSPDRHEYQFYYDWQAACKKAREEGWNAEPYDAPNQVARAVEADYQFLRAFLRQDWYYVGIVIEDAHGRMLDSVWGVESYKDYHLTMAQEMLQDVALCQEEEWLRIAEESY